MSRKLSLFALLASLTIALCAPGPAEAGGGEPAEPLVPRAAFASAAAGEGGKLRLVAKKFVTFEPDGLSLEPADPLVAETLETPVMLSLTIPGDNSRTHFLLSSGALHTWEQIPSTAPYRMTGALRYLLTSSALPAPGQMGFGVGLDSQSDGQPSAANTFRQRDQTSSFGLDDEVLTFLVKGNFPALTDEQALQTARALIKSEIAMTMTVRVRVRSVSSFNITNAYLQVWGD